VKEKTSVTIKMRHDLTPPNSIGFYILSSVDGILSIVCFSSVTAAASLTIALYRRASVVGQEGGLGRQVWLLGGARGVQVV
jgi:hypothetical protein